MRHSACSRVARAFIATSSPPLAAPRMIRTVVSDSRPVVMLMAGNAAGKAIVVIAHSAVSRTLLRIRAVTSIAGTAPRAIPNRAIPNSESRSPRRSLTNGIRGAQLESTAPLMKKMSHRPARTEEREEDTGNPWVALLTAGDPLPDEHRSSKVRHMLREAGV